jgi:hypothetical protein
MRTAVGHSPLDWKGVEAVARVRLRLFGLPRTLSGRVEIALASILLIVCAARFWIAPLSSSLWVDEMVTIFVVHHGSSDPSLAVAPQIRNSAYYVLPRLSEKLFGASEAAYRIPSVLVMAVAFFFIARLASRLVHKNAGWFAIFACLALSGVNYEADDARPYAFGTCVAAAAAYYLTLWLDDGRWRNAMVFLGCAALLWRIRLIFWPFYIVLALYALVRVVTRETDVTWVRVAGVFAALAILLIPVLIDAVGLLRNARAHVIVPQPRLRDFRHSLHVPLPLLIGANTFLLSRWFKWKPAPAPAPRSVTALFAGWWLVPPVALYVFSYVTGDSVFLARDLAIGLPGAALAATLAASCCVAPDRWRQLAIVLGTIILIFAGPLRIPVKRHDKSDWRTAAARIDALRLQPDTPIICPSPFIEARPPVWRPDYRLPGFLYSHLPVYAITGKPYLFPFEFSPDARSYATRLTEAVLPRFKRFVIYGGDHNVLMWRDWFAAQPELAHWRNRRLGPFGDVDAVVFER